MGWSIENSDFKWPDDFLRTKHTKGNKDGEIEDILEALEIAKKLHSGLSDFPFPAKKGTAAAAQSWGDSALTFFSGAPFKKLMGSLAVIKVRSEKLTKEKKTSSNAKASLKAIITAIDDVADSVQLNKITLQINKIKTDMIEADKQFVLGRLKNVFKSYRDCAARKHPEIAAAAQEVVKWQDDDIQLQQEIRNRVSALLTDAARDMTQNTQNLVKAFGYGADITGLEDRDKVTIPKINKTLVPIANHTDSLTTDMDKRQLALLIRTVKVTADLYDEIGKRIPT
jgi:hypothetical protein